VPVGELVVPVSKPPAPGASVGADEVDVFGGTAAVPPAGAAVRTVTDADTGDEFPCPSRAETMNA